MVKKIWPYIWSLRLYKSVVSVCSAIAQIITTYNYHHWTYAQRSWRGSNSLNTWQLLWCMYTLPPLTHEHTHTYIRTCTHAHPHTLTHIYIISVFSYFRKRETVTRWSVRRRLSSIRRGLAFKAAVVKQLSIVSFYWFVWLSAVLWPAN